jgi:hypothetical protein
VGSYITSLLKDAFSVGWVVYLVFVKKVLSRKIVPLTWSPPFEERNVQCFKRIIVNDKLERV